VDYVLIPLSTFLTIWRIINMETLSVDTETLNLVNTLAHQLNTSQIDVVRQAVNNYIDKIQRKNRLISFAGILDETEADSMLNAIQDNRVNKTIGI